MELKSSFAEQKAWDACVAARQIDWAIEGHRTGRRNANATQRSNCEKNSEALARSEASSQG
jgi:hypothetical protein